MFSHDPSLAQALVRDRHEQLRRQVAATRQRALARQLRQRQRHRT